MEKFKAFIKVQFKNLKSYLKSDQFKVQVQRALRLFAMAFVVSVTGLFKSHAVSAKALAASAVAALEVTYRAFVPAADPKAPSATITPIVSEPNGPDANQED